MAERKPKLIEQRRGLVRGVDVRPGTEQQVDRIQVLVARRGKERHLAFLRRVAASRPSQRHQTRMRLPLDMCFRCFRVRALSANPRLALASKRRLTANVRPKRAA